MRNLLLLCAFCFSNSLVAAPEVKGSPEELKSFLYPSSKTLFIKELAEETAYSDQAIVNLVVTTEAKTLGSAIEKNTTLREAIKDSLIKKNIKAENIKNSNFSSSPEFGWFGKEPSSYKVINRIAIRIDQEKALQDIANISDNYPEVILSSTQFEHSKKDAFSQKVKQMALEKIMVRKAFYESTLGVKLTAVGFDESRVDMEATDGASHLEEVVVTAARNSKDSFSSKSHYDVAVKMESFDEIRYTALISVEFKIN